MRRRILNYIEREREILSYVGTRDFASTEDICGLLGASLATVRRDFGVMSEKGLVERVRGGIRSAQPAAAGARDGITTPVDLEKSRIAQYASSLVHENDSIFIGSGKTCNLFARCLKHIDYLTVVTTSLNAATELADRPNFSIYLLGGSIHCGTNFIETVISDSELEYNLGSLFFDKTFITVDGVDLECGYTIRYRNQIPLYTKLLENSKSFNLMVDSYKFNRRSFVPAFDMEQIRNVVSTGDVPRDYVDFYREKGIKLHII